MYDKDGKASTVDKINYGSSASQSMNRYYSYQVENTLTYDKVFGKHALNVVLGQSAYMSSSSYLGASALGLVYPDDPWKIIPPTSAPATSGVPSRPLPWAGTSRTRSS